LFPGSIVDRFSPHAWSLAIGCVLPVFSVFPSRWRGKAVVAEDLAPPRPEEPEAAAPAPPPLPKRIPSRY
jgi:hypothetical protein